MFQIPFGALRLVILPIGWTNSVLIFHNDVTEILKEKIPEYTMPYIDNISLRGPLTQYELPNGSYEILEENPGIHHFVFEYINNVNYMLQHIKYTGEIFSGSKMTICTDKITIVGDKTTRNFDDGTDDEGEEFDLEKITPETSDPLPLDEFWDDINTKTSFINEVAQGIKDLTWELSWANRERTAEEKLKTTIAGPFQCQVLVKCKPVLTASSFPSLVGVTNQSLAKVDLWVDSCAAAYGGISLLTSQVASPKEIQVITVTIRQHLDHKVQAALPMSWSYLKIMDVPYFRPGSKDFIDSGYVREVMKCSHIASSFVLANFSCVMQNFWHADSATV
ncbi:hypothetical protein AN958_09134 [Leucoagaricus sp. SymC.cos]|nr:hypothetical protein AN958_09134 [Leucoagaricus sp. SymC.cos]